MKQKKVYLAVDLGAGSGRVLAGEFDGETITLKELHRFDNRATALPDGYHWDTPGLFNEIVAGLRAAGAACGKRAISVGIDTWGVDYGLLDGRGRLLGLPYQYRDSRTDGMMEAAFEAVPKRELYDRTGIQFMPINTVYQLLAEKRAQPSLLDHAEALLFTPDLLGYWLSGTMAQERTIASTSQLYDPRTHDWDRELLDRLGLPQALFKPLADPGTTLGPLRDAIAEATGLPPIQVVSVAGHDTASAVAAVPSGAAHPAYLSSGTWSLMGLEFDRPVIDDDSFADQFTNEVGIGGKIRFLKNISGLWLIQECRRFWKTNGEDYSFGEMAALADDADPLRLFINPDDPAFMQPGNMPERICAACRNSGQPMPENPGEIVRCIYESLALRYREVWHKLRGYAETAPAELHIVGGGSQDDLLNQFTADATGVQVVAGPVEATGLGNVLAQMLADGSIETIQEGRRIVERSFPLKRFDPGDRGPWDAAAERFAELKDS